MNDSSANNPDGNVIFSGTKEVAENLKFNELGLQEWFGDSIPSAGKILKIAQFKGCLLYTSPSPRDATLSRMPSSA